MAQANLQVVLEGIDNTKRAFQSAGKQVDGFRGKLEKNRAAFQKMALAGTAAFAGISVAVGKAIQEAGDAEKIAFNFENTFGKSSEAIGNFIEDFGDKFAFVESELQSGANAIGFQFNAMGDITQEETERMTKDLLTAAGGLSDFFGEQVNVTEAANAMAKGLAGNRQQLIDMGFNVLEEDIKAAAKAMGINTDEMTKAQEAMVFTNLIMEQTQGSVKGLDSTFDTFTGQQRAFNKATKETAQTLGTVFLPLATDLLKALRPVIENIASWVEANPKLTKVIIIATAALAGLVAVVGVLGLVLPAVITGFALLFSPITLIVALITAALIPVIILLTKHWDLLKNGAITAFNNIGETINAVISTIVAKFTGFKAKSILLWRAIKDTIKDTVDAIKDTIRSFIRLIQDAIDKLVELKNKTVGGVSNFIGNVRGGAGIVGNAISNVVPFANGGVVTKPTLGLVGEAGPEAIIPLNKMRGGGVTVNIQGGTYLSEDAAEHIGDVLIERLQRELRF